MYISISIYEGFKIIAVKYLVDATLVKKKFATFSENGYKML